MNIKNMRSACLGLSTLVCLVVAQSCIAAQYCNSKYNYCIDYPNNLKPQPEASNGDGRHFTLKNSSASIAVYAGNTPSVLGQTESSYLKQLKAETHQHSIAYESLKGDRYAYSYLTPTGHIFYGWVIVKDGSDYHLEFDYPQSEKVVIDPMIKQMSQGFKVY